METTTINIKPHLAEYLNAKYYNSEENCVCLPDKLDLYHAIWDLLEKLPVNCTPTLKGNLTLGLPHRREGKDPKYFNYLGERSVKIIERRIYTLYLAEIHDLLNYNKHVLGLEYLETAHQFSRKYNIESISTDGIIKEHYRWRKTLTQKERRRRYKKQT